MHFGVFTALQNRTWPDLLDLSRHLEATGWDIACVSDHLVSGSPTREGTNLEALSSLSALAALVPRIRLGTIVLSNTFRHPAVVAKMATQIDIISQGRLILGLGTGWRASEHEAYGIPLPGVRERLERLDEACQVIRSLWTERRSTFKGRYYQLSDAPLDPKPVQTPHPPLMIGGGGERVTLRLVAAHGDVSNFFGGPKVFARKGPILDQHCAEIGRDPKTIRRSANMFLLFTSDQREIDRLAEAVAAGLGDHVSDSHDACLAGTPAQIRERLHQVRAAGVDTVFIPTMFRPVAELRRDLDRFIAEIAPEFR